MRLAKKKVSKVLVGGQFENLNDDFGVTTIDLLNCYINV